MVFKILEILFLVLCIDYVGFASAFTFNRDNLIDYSNELLLHEERLPILKSRIDGVVPIAPVSKEQTKRNWRVPLFSDDVFTITNRRDLIVARNDVSCSLIYRRPKPLGIFENTMSSTVGIFPMGAIRQEGEIAMGGMDADSYVEQGQVMQKAFPPDLPANPIPIDNGILFLLCAVGGYAYIIWLSKVIT